VKKGARPQKTASSGVPSGAPKRVAVVAAKRPVASNSGSKGKSAGKPVGASGEGIRFFQSSEARSRWSEVLKTVSEGGNVAILYGTRAFALKEVELTYAEREYGVTDKQLNEKAKRMEKEGDEQIGSGRARRVI
jgi:hypothetical protein